MRLFIFKCDPGAGFDPEYKAVSDRIIDEAEERCFSVYGCVPISALRYGIPQDAETVEAVDIEETEDRGTFTLAWDKAGQAWKVSNLADDHIWERDPEHDRSQITK